MKKRQHIRQALFTNKVNGSRSHRSQRSSLRAASEEMSGKLAAFEKLANTVSDWTNDNELELKLADELSEAELNQFSFSCIETLAKLKRTQRAYLTDALMGVVEAKLPSYASLVVECKEAKEDFQKTYQLSKQLISNSASMETSAQVLECVQDSMCRKHRAESLAKRVEFLQSKVPSYVAHTGVQLGFPESLMNKVAKSIQTALGNCV